MRKIVTAICLSVLIYVLAGCNVQPKLKGSYQSETDVNGYHIQLSIHHADHRFVEYIDNREVDSGSYEEVGDGEYLLKSDKQEFTINLTKDNTFLITLKKLNDGKPIKMINLGDTPVSFPAHFDKVDEYIKLIEE